MTEKEKQDALDAIDLATRKLSMAHSTVSDDRLFVAMQRLVEATAATTSALQIVAGRVRAESKTS